MVDTSYSTSEDMFQQQKDYITNVISRLTLSDEKFKVAVASYGSNTNIDVQFDSYSNNKTALLEQVSKLSFVNGTTDIHNASYNVRDMLKIASRSNQFVIFFTDGMPTDLKLALNGTGELRTHLFNVSSSSDLIFVSFGEDVRHEGLKRMSGDPRLGDIFPPTSKEPLYHILNRLVDAKCTGNFFKHSCINLVLVRHSTSYEKVSFIFSERLIIISFSINFSLLPSRGAGCYVCIRHILKVITGDVFW